VEQPICAAQWYNMNYRIALKYLVQRTNSFYTFLMPGVLKYPTKQMISVWLFRQKGLVETSNIPEKFPGDLIK
jgi:hypothetical protein